MRKLFKNNLISHFGRKDSKTDIDMKEGRRATSAEPRTEYGNYIGNTGNQLTEPKHVNDEIGKCYDLLNQGCIEKELIIFKKEIEEKYAFRFLQICIFAVLDQLIWVFIGSPRPI
jgi:hypothetical protein